ncbi:MAG: diadenylate cyclase CdaA [Phycisphaerae bacterium]
MQDVWQTVWTYFNRVRTYNPAVVMVELFLIGLVVWWVMRFLRGTRGARLIKGVVLLLGTIYVVIRLLPKSLGWDRLEFLYGKFLLFAFVAVIVAFQPELRRALIQLGQARLFRNIRGEVEPLVEALVDSASYLSRNKIGAIIAVERTAPLASLAESGTQMDCRVSASVLNTIFYPGSVLHDMGVIIRNGRIAAAGCQFPLAESEDADASLGSRHRAALGLAQECDALVLVVSEESGRVSLAYDGHLEKGLEPQGLREMLRGLLSPGLLVRGRRGSGGRKEGT